MSKINEIFYSLQGEGRHSGEAAVFVRFSGCNLKCPFCDTLHESGTEMTEEEIVAEASRYPTRLVVLTGGEPSLWIGASLVDRLHEAGKYIAVETNGTNPLPDGVDWITMSPKAGMAPGADVMRLQRADEIKVVDLGQDLERYFLLPQRGETTLMYLQPCFVDDAEEYARNVERTVGRVKADSRWRLSAQLHRFLQIP
ncbi:MAG: radical SAM protein [Bacteroides sp.]|nr:radical SAM protein [Bacteroides sp.]